MRSLRVWAAESAELLDDPNADSTAVVASLHDIARINRVFGGAGAAARRLAQFFPVPAGPSGPAGSSAECAAPLTLLDVGTGLGDIARAAATLAGRRGLRLALVGLDSHRAAARAAARECGVAAVVGDGGRLPFRSRSVDYILCAKLLHHLPGEAGTTLLREMDRVARRAVVVADIRRSPIAAAGLWLASFPLRFHPATRRDGVISVFRGFSARELAERCAAAGVSATVRRHAGWSLTAAWRPAGAA